MSKKILMVSTGEYGGLYAHALAKAIKGLSGDITIEFMGGTGAPSSAAKAGSGEKKFDCIVLMDGPSPYMPFLKKAKEGGAKVIFYGGSANGPSTVKTIKKAAGLIDLALAHFPFAISSFKEAGIKNEFAGHPLIDIMDSPLSLREAKEAIGYDWTELPLSVIAGDGGEALYKTMFEGAAEAAAVSTRKVRLIVPDAERHSDSFIKELVEISPKRTKVIKGKRREALLASEVVVAGPGTATLEAALAGAQILTVKKTPGIRGFLNGLGGNYQKISLPNIILKRPLCPEISEREVTILKITQELSGLIESSTKNEFDDGIAELKGMLGPSGAIKRAAGKILKALEIR